ncbi:MAG: thioredoxin [Clostridia bacterium]|nr:thioredoxin [Clostridia bacterium]
MAEVKITATNFESEVIGSDIPVLVDFWATWCGPCRMLGPVIAEIAEEQEGKIKVGKVNVDEEGALASKFGIMSIPTVLVFKNGEVTATSIGYKPKEDILAMLGL